MTGAARPSGPSREPPVAGRPLVLVVDDERGTVTLMHDMLEHIGFQVAVAFDGLEALVRARELRPALVLLDVMMPGMDGRDVCRTLREDPSFDGTVVVLHSAADERDVDWRAAGADAFLQKPFPIRDLPRLARGYLVRGDRG